MAGELVHTKIERYAQRHNVSYAEAMAEVLSDEGDPDVAAYKRGEPGAAEEVQNLKAAVAKQAGLVLDQRARVRAKREKTDVWTAFQAECRRDPKLAKQYGLAAEQRSLVSWWRRSA
jgi:hypothetical protein